MHRSLNTAAEELAAIGPSPDTRTGVEAQGLAGRLCTLVRDEWPGTDHEAFLARAGEHCRKLHDLVIAAYVDYAVEDLPVR